MFCNYSKLTNISPWWSFPKMTTSSPLPRVGGWTCLGHLRNFSSQTWFSLWETGWGKSSDFPWRQHLTHILEFEEQLPISPIGRKYTPVSYMVFKNSLYLARLQGTLLLWHQKRKGIYKWVILIKGDFRKLDTWEKQATVKRISPAYLCKNQQLLSNWVGIR